MKPVSVKINERAEDKITAKVYISMGKLRMPVDITGVEIKGTPAVDHFNKKTVTKLEAERIVQSVFAMNLSEGVHNLEFGKVQ